MVYLVMWSKILQTPVLTQVCTFSKVLNMICIIGLGGGSPMDTAKAISFMSVNAGHVRDYKAPTQIDACGPPVILIPTTGGTGSELTRWCVITDTKNTEKYNLSGLACVATAALIDWTFTTTKPGGLLQIQPWIVSLTL